MARTRNEKLLASMELFGDCTTKEVSVIAALCTEISFAAGETMMTQGRSAQEFFAIVSGEADVVRDGAITATLSAGSPVGEMAMIERTVRSATVTAISDMRALVLSKREFVSARHASAGFDSTLRTFAERRASSNAAAAPAAAPAGRACSRSLAAA